MLKINKLNDNINLLFSDKNFFRMFIFFHVFAWTIVLSLTRFALDTSGDTLENYAWGLGWQLGYFKHPPFTAYLVALWFKIFPNTNFFYLLLSQLNIAICFITIFKIAKYYVPKNVALISVIILEFIPFYSFLDIKINPNSLLITLFMIVALFLYKAVMYNKVKDWLFLAIFSAVAFLTKYTTSIFLLSIFILLLVTRDGRKVFFQYKLYLAALVFVVIVTPHVFWLFENDFMPIHYATKHIDPSLWQRIYALSLLPKYISFLLIPIIILYLFFRVKIDSNLYKYNDFKRLFPWFMTVVPIFIMIIIGVVFGARLSSRWIKPFFCLAPLIYITYNNGNFSLQRIRKFKEMVILYIIFVPFIYLVSHIYFPKLSKKYASSMSEVAYFIQSEWDRNFNEKLQYVTGSYVIANAVSFYAKDNPKALLSFNYKITPWIDEKDVTKRGIAVVCESDDINCVKSAEQLWPNIKFKLIEIKPSHEIFKKSKGGLYKYSFVEGKTNL